MVFQQNFLRTVLCVSGLLLSVNSALAVDSPEIRSACYETLKENMREIGILRKEYLFLEDKRYNVVEGRLSKMYRNMGSFGVDLRKPLFDLRLYDWGKETGYIHPPLGPYPSTQNSDIWEKPAQQNIFAEEYIRDHNGKRHFLGCGFFLIQAEDLNEVTREKYLYDGDLISIKKDGEGYKAWYNENQSYDLKDKPFVTWKRLFIYPEETSSTFFDRYKILDAMPGTKVEDFGELFNTNSTGDGVNYVVYGQFGEILNASNPLLRPVRWDENRIFAFNSYYRAIESTFPELGEELSIHGALSYDSLKGLMEHWDDTKQNSIWSVVGDVRDVKRYYIQRETGQLKEERPIFEGLLAEIPNAENKAKELLAPFQTKVVDVEPEDLTDMETESVTQEEELDDINWKALGAGGMLLLILIGGGVLYRMKRKS